MFHWILNMLNNNMSMLKSLKQEIIGKNEKQTLKKRANQRAL